MSNRNYVFNTADEALPNILHELLGKPETGSRNGAMRELTMVSISILQPRKREITNPERKASLPAQIAETMWVLSGRDDVEFLSRYLPRAKDFSDDGKVWRGGYGPRLRKNSTGQDPLWEVVKLLRKDPETRRAVISIWDNDRDYVDSKDIPCNDTLHFLARDGVLELHVFTRSNDIIWGWSGINQFEWSALLELVAALTGMKMGAAHFSISSLHLYKQHYERARQIILASDPVELLDRAPRYARFGLSAHTSEEDLYRWFGRWFGEEEKARGVNVHVAAPWGMGDSTPLEELWSASLCMFWGAELEGSTFRRLPDRMQTALLLSPSNIRQRPIIKTYDRRFDEEVIALHRDKDAAYGDSWCKRGEKFSILPNIARKVDRLASGKDTDDETQLDTAVDLYVYLAKYSCWLDGRSSAPIEDVEKLIRSDRKHLIPAGEVPQAVKRIEEKFEHILGRVEQSPKSDYHSSVIRLRALAGNLAYTRWCQQGSVNTEQANQ